jgi:hypothetical protein
MRRCRVHGATKSQSGYALLLALFLMVLVLVTLTAAGPNLITEARREKELEMIWRGKQYVRGIRLYYQKLHHFPTQLDDLYKPKTGIRFMRQPYKDPMNTTDGTWRIIYVGPVGQIIGSLTQPTNPINSGASPVNALNSSLASSPTPTDCQASSSNSGNPLESPGAATLPNTRTSQCDPQDPNLALAQNDTTGAGNDIVGAGIIGVGSKINKGSIISFEGEKNYLHFEFIWKVQTADPATVVPNP